MKIKNLIGEMSGSVGALTFSRNSSGFYVKNRPNPVNPNTPIQAEARARFAYCQGLYRAATEAAREAWRTYGANVFVSKDGKTGLSGANAYSALAMQAMGAQRISELTTVSGTPTGAAKGALALPTLPPNSAGTVIAKGTTLNVAATLGTVSYAKSGVGTFQIVWSSPLVQATGALKDINGRGMGFVGFVSQPFTNSDGFPVGTRSRMFAAAGNLVSMPASTTSILFTGEGMGVPEKMYVRITVYAIDEYGQVALVGAKNVIVT